MRRLDFWRVDNDEFWKFNCLLVCKFRWKIILCALRFRFLILELSVVVVSVNWYEFIGLFFGWVFFNLSLSFWMVFLVIGFLFLFLIRLSLSIMFFFLRYWFEMRLIRDGEELMRIEYLEGIISFVVVFSIALRRVFRCLLGIIRVIVNEEK